MEQFFQAAEEFNRRDANARREAEEIINAQNGRIERLYSKVSEWLRKDGERCEIKNETIGSPYHAILAGHSLTITPTIHDDGLTATVKINQNVAANWVFDMGWGRWQYQNNPNIPFDAKNLEYSITNALRASRR